MEGYRINGRRRKTGTEKWEGIMSAGKKEELGGINKERMKSAGEE
jgi:hypothetical protein